MMTVGELISLLEDYEEDTPVVIGMYQNYGSNFAMLLTDSIEQLTVHDWDDGDYEAVVLTEGRQIGTVEYEE